MKQVMIDNSLRLPWLQKGFPVLQRDYDCRLILLFFVPSFAMLYT